MKTQHLDICIHDPNESGKTANRLIQVLTSRCDADILCRPITVLPEAKDNNLSADSVRRK